MFLEIAYGVGTLMSAYKTYNDYQSAAAVAKYQAGIAEQNAALAKKEKRQIEKKSLETTKRLESQTKEFIAEQLVTYSSSGVDTSSATVQEVIRSTARTGATDIVDASSNFAKEAWGKDIESRLHTMEAAGLRKSASRYKVLAPYATGLNILTGAAQLSFMIDAKPETISPRGTGIVNNPNVAVNFP